MAGALHGLWNNPKVFLPTLAVATVAIVAWHAAANPFDRIPMPDGGFVDAVRGGPIASLAWPIARARSAEVNAKATLPVDFFPGTDRPKPEMLGMVRELFHIVKGTRGIRMELTLYTEEGIELAGRRAHNVEYLLNASIAPPDVVTASGAAGPSRLEVVVRWNPETTRASFEPIRLACGASGPLKDREGAIWMPDPAPQGGLVWENRSSVENTRFPELFHRQRFTAQPVLRYDLSAPDGEYFLTLWFAETFFHAPGKRAFDIDVNGTRIESSFDIVAAAGAPYRAVSRRYAVRSVGGKVVIEMRVVENAPSINGIELAAK